MQDNAQQLKNMHLKDLLQDEERCASLVAEHEGIVLDFSRQNVLPTTMVMSLSHEEILVLN